MFRINCLWRSILLVALITLALVIMVSGCTSKQSTFISNKKTIIITVQPTLDAAEVQEKAKPLKEFLEKELAKQGTQAEVSIYVPLSYSGAVEALRFGKADVALMGAWPAFLATELGAGELTLVEIREVIMDQDKKEAPYYYSYWVVPKESQYRSLEELRGKRVVFPSPVSTSGYVIPIGRLVELGLLTKPAKGEADPKQFFGSVQFAGGYAQSWEALKKGQADVMVIAGDVPEKLYWEVLNNTRVLEKQGPVPSHVVVFSKALQDPVRSHLREAFLALNDPQQTSLMRKFVSGIFVRFEPSTAEQHFAGLKKYLDLSGIQFSERIER